jgi:glutathione S-transferase
MKPAVKRIEDVLSRSAWLAGEAYSIADIDTFAMLAPIPDLAPEVVNDHATPGIAAFLRRMQERPAVKAALASSRTGRPHEAFVPSTEPSRWG